MTRQRSVSPANRRASIQDLAEAIQKKRFRSLPAGFAHSFSQYSSFARVSMADWTLLQRHQTRGAHVTYVLYCRILTLYDRYIQYCKSAISLYSMYDERDRYRRNFQSSY